MIKLSDDDRIRISIRVAELGMIPSWVVDEKGDAWWLELIMHDGHNYRATRVTREFLTGSAVDLLPRIATKLEASLKAAT